MSTPSSELHIQSNGRINLELPSPCLSPTHIRSSTCQIPFTLAVPYSSRNLLFLCKDHDDTITEMFQFILKLCSFKCFGRTEWNFFLEQSLTKTKQFIHFQDDLQYGNLLNAKFHFWSCVEKCKSDISLYPKIDLIITLGGDGTVLYAAWQFQGVPVPPLLPLYVHGTLGFLTVFDMDSAIDHISKLMKTEEDPNRVALCVNVRMRLRCCVYRAGNTEFPDVFHVLNEVTLDRGPSPYMSLVDLYANDVLMTTAHADGVVVATPTGSTAYSMSAGGSIVHPGVPCILLTPICAHTLSFRPLILPDNVQIKAAVSLQSRGSINASFDGRHRIELNPGDFLLISVSNYPVFTVTNTDQTDEWMGCLSKCLKWNEQNRHR